MNLGVTMHSASRFVAFALLLSAAVATSQTKAPKPVHQDEFFVVGIEARTIGEREVSDEGVIPGLWQRFYQERVLEKIPNKADSSIYVVYTEYARDRMGDYTVVIGVKVKDKSPAPTGLVLKTVPAGQYALVTSEKGPAATVIPEAWQKVWALEDKDLLDGKRAYKADFELYGPQATNPQNLQADLYVGLK
jgi:predicted transcriptional regulator YdeE